MASFGEILTMLHDCGQRVTAGVRACLHQLCSLWLTWLKQTSIIVGFWTLLFLSRTAWHNLTNAPLPLSELGPIGSILQDLLAVSAQLLHGGVQLFCRGLAHVLVATLLVHASRVPFYLLIAILGQKAVLNKTLVSFSLFFSLALVALYFFGADNVFARGVSVRRASLFDAAATNDTAAAREVLQRQGGARQQFQSGWPFKYTPLHEASRRGHTAVVELFIRAGSNVSQENVFGDTALFLAMSNGHADVAGLLIRAGADPNHCNVFGDTPLMTASYHGNIGQARQLLAAGASVGATNIYGDTALSLAIRQRHWGLVKYLHGLWTRQSLSSLVRRAVATACIKAWSVVAGPLSVAGRPVGRALRQMRWLSGAGAGVQRSSPRFESSRLWRRPGKFQSGTQLVLQVYPDGSDLEGPCEKFRETGWLHSLGYTDVICVDSPQYPSMFTVGKRCQRCAAAVPECLPPRDVILCWRACGTQALSSCTSVPTDRQPRMPTDGLFDMNVGIGTDTDIMSSTGTLSTSRHDILRLVVLGTV